MANRLGGVLNIIAGGVALEVRGAVTLRTGSGVRTAVVGQTGTHGYTEEPSTPGVSVEVSHRADFDLAALKANDDMTLQIDLQDGSSYALANAWLANDPQVNLIDAGTTLEFDGLKLEKL
jgi:hypothetical protein